MKQRILFLSTLLAVSLFLSACEPYTEPSNSSQVQEQWEIPPDIDNDKISDSSEDWVAQTFGPYFIHDEQELADSVQYVYQVTPVLLNNQPRVLFIVVALYDLDWAEYSEKLDIDVKWHYGDAESIRFFLRVMTNYPDDPYRRFEGEYSIAEVLIRRHGGGYDYSRNDFEYREGTHPVLWVSEGKHAMFPSSDDCENHSFMTGFDEDCGGGPEWYGSLPFAVNVGEMELKSFEYTDERKELSAFPGERIWDRDYPFCGGYDVGDERWDYWAVPYFGDWPTCAGAVGDKWFPFPP
jgi:hypothetical protein